MWRKVRESGGTLRWQNLLWLQQNQSLVCALVLLVHLGHKQSQRILIKMGGENYSAGDASLSVYEWTKTSHVSGRHHQGHAFWHFSLWQFMWDVCRLPLPWKQKTFIISPLVVHVVKGISGNIQMARKEKRFRHCPPFYLHHLSWGERSNRICANTNLNLFSVQRSVGSMLGRRTKCFFPNDVFCNN